MMAIFKMHSSLGSLIREDLERIHEFAFETSRFH
jgi:hypothetical protein